MDTNIKDKLLFARKNAALVMSAAETKEADDYCKKYIDFLNEAKTERTAVYAAISMAEKEGFIPWKKGMKLKCGDKVFCSRRGKALILCTIGKKNLTEGVSIIASHIDSPRLDFKMQPIYEDSGMAFFDTHYYGGIKPYQWTGIPLALYGYIIRSDGQSLDIKIGEDPDDPRFFVADLLPHLGDEQMKKPAKDAVPAENLDILAGLVPAPGESGPDAVKINMLRLLYEKYGITEKDLVSAELSAVPAFPATDIGLDRSMIGAYGHDDKVCAYPSMRALFSVKEPEYTSCVVLADKEETGSHGISGMQSNFFAGFIDDLAEDSGINGNRNTIFLNSFCISADVNTCWYPLYKEVFDEHGESKLNHGLVLYRSSGSGGKDNTNDADTRTSAEIIKIMDDANVLWQTGEGGKVDAGSGGTIARFFANLNIPTIDLGVSLISMHSPLEGVAKADVYMAHRAFAAFFKRV